MKYIILALLLSKVAAFAITDSYVCDEVKEIERITAGYKQGSREFRELREQISSFVQTGNYGRYNKGINYNRMATPAERLIMYDAVITVALMPEYSENIFKSYKDFLSDTSKHIPPLAFHHQLAIYSVITLAKSCVENGYEPIKDFGKLATEISGFLPTPTPFNMARYLSNLYTSAPFKESLIRANVIYDPEMLAFKEKEKAERGKPQVLESGAIKEESGIMNMLYNLESFHMGFEINSKLQVQIGKIERKNLATESKCGEKTAIYYDVIARNDVFQKKKEPKGVIIEVYGAEDTLVSNLSSYAINKEFLQRYHILARAGYLFYRIHPRGSVVLNYPYSLTGPEESSFTQDGTEGILTLVRDVAYFAARVQHDNAWIGDRTDPTDLIQVSERVRGKKIPVILTGSSFGGMLTMMVATSNEPITTSDSGVEKTQTISEIFDAYIPQAAYNIEDDLESHTAAAFSRSHASGLKDWFALAFPKLEYKETSRKIKKDSIAPYSIYQPLKHLKRPVLLVHGLNDNNVTPQASTNLAKKSWGSAVQQYISLYLEGEVGHFVGARESSDVENGEFKLRDREFAKYFERIFTFLDLVRWHKTKDSVFTLSLKDQAETHALAQNAAMFMTAYSTNPKLHSVFEQFMAAVIKTTITDTEPDMWAEKGKALLEMIQNNGPPEGLKGMPTLLLAALLDLKSRDVSLYYSIDLPLEESWKLSTRKNFLKDAYETIFANPFGTTSGAGAGAGSAPKPEEAHVLPRFYAWKDTCLKDPDKIGCEINPKLYLEALVESSEPADPADPKIKKFWEKMHTYVFSPKLDISNPMEKVTQILIDRLTKPEFDGYRKAIQKTQDAFTTPILDYRAAP